MKRSLLEFESKFSHDLHQLGTTTQQTLLQKYFSMKKCSYFIGRIGSSNSFFGNSPFAPGNYTMPRKKASPIISSPVPSHSINHGTVPSVSTRVSSAKNYSNQKFKPMRSRSANPAYKRQVMSQHPAVATQTPKFLGSTVKPNLDWNHHALSEEEIRKTLKDRPRTGQARPNWKP